jgi:oligopeptide/dipeptide ABC transporter ATP-binding protein
VTEPLLSIEHLSVEYRTQGGVVQAVSDVSLSIPEGRVVGIVGETGCGKSTLAQAIPRLLPEPPARIASGRIVFRGTDLAQTPARRLPLVRGTGIGMIFQEPLNSLNPAVRVYDQIAEAVLIRRWRDAGFLPTFRGGANPFDYSGRPLPEPASVLTRPIVPGGAVVDRAREKVSGRSATRAEVLGYLRLVRIQDPETILDRYPHELSGGMRQRIMIAMVLSERPSLLIADEPTSALDVTIQAQVLTLMKDLIDEVHASILFISHDFGVIAEIADDLGVMYAGRLVEVGPVAEVFRSPKHPYTKSLLRAIPNRYKSDGPLSAIPGAVPSLFRPPSGCRYHPRCSLARPPCRLEPSPELLSVPGMADGGAHRSACHFASEVATMP